MVRPHVHRRPALAVLLAAALLPALAGCVAPPATEPEPTPTATAAPVETVAPIALVPAGTAGDNLPFFTQIVQSVWAGSERDAGRAYVDALAAAGFDKTAMQVTADRSTVGNPAESILVSVRWGEECLIGQVGPATGDPVAQVMHGLSHGGCLVGQTRPIDW